MKITIEIDHQDIVNASQEAFVGLLGALQGIVSADKHEDSDTDEVIAAQESVATGKKASRATKTSESKKNSVKTASPKVSEEKTVKTEPEEEPVKDGSESKTEPEAEVKVEAEEPAAEKEAEKAEEAQEEPKVDYKVIRAEIKKVGTALGQKDKDKYVPKIKALIKEYGVTTIPDLPDTKLEEFLEKLKGLE